MRYDDLTRWEFRADNGLMLRGRRTDGAGSTVHFLSGNGFCGGVYWPFLRTFLPQRGLFVHDIEGQGESDAPGRFSGLAALLRRVRVVAEEQGLARQPLVGMGHSFGAAATLRLAAAHPGMFSALVLLDPIVFPTGAWLVLRAISLAGQHPFSKAALRRRTAWPSREDALRHLRGRGIYKGWTDEALACFVDFAMKPQGGEWVLRCPRTLEAQIYDRPIYPWRAFAEVDCPVLFLRGAQSYDFFPRAERKAARLNPRVQVQTLPGGHCFMQEDPSAAHRAVDQFLSGLKA